MKQYLWKVEYVKYSTTHHITAVASSIPQLFKFFSSKLKKEYVPETAVISVVREDGIDWIKTR